MYIYIHIYIYIYIYITGLQEKILSEKIRWGKFLLEDDNVLPVFISSDCIMH